MRQNPKIYVDSVVCCILQNIAIIDISQLFDAGLHNALKNIQIVTQAVHTKHFNAITRQSMFTPPSHAATEVMPH